MTYSYSQYAQKLNEAILKLEEGAALEMAVRDTIPEMAARIFEQGQNSNEGKIGSYSTKEIYVSDNQAPKQVNHTGKTGRTIKSGYYGGGYRQFRSEMGREAGFVNLRLNNQLQSDFLNSSIGEGADGLAPFPGTAPFKVNNNHYRIGLKSDINAKKRRGLERKYGVIFQPTKKEEDNFLKVYEFEMQKILNV